MTLKKPGIYCITNLINHKKYIGQSVNVERRLTDHIVSLSKGTNPNYDLQHDFDLYSIYKFKFEIVIRCDIGELNELEKKYIAKFKSFEKGYNKTKGGSQVYSNYKVHSKSPYSDIFKTIDTNATNYTFYYIDGSSYTGTIRNFCYDHKIYIYGVLCLVTNLKKCISGWVIDDSLFKTKYHWGSHRSDVYYWTLSLSELYKQISIPIKSIQYFLNNPNKKTVSKYKVLNDDQLPKQKDTFNFYHYTGKTELNIGMHDFIKKYNYRFALIDKLIKGEIKSAYGWVVNYTLLTTTYTFTNRYHTIIYKDITIPELHNKVKLYDSSVTKFFNNPSCNFSKYKCYNRT